MSLKQLLSEFKRDFEVLPESDPVEMVVNPLACWCVMSAIQLACRHPEFDGPTREVAEGFARKLQERVAVTPALQRVAAMGWDPEFDIDVGVDHERREGDLPEPG